VRGLVALADALDELADLGVTMSQIRNPLVAGREQYLADLLGALQERVAAVEPLTGALDLEPEARARLRSTLLACSAGLVAAFGQLAAGSVSPNETAQSNRAAVVANWNALRDLIEELASALGLSSDPCCAAVLERQPVYRQLVGHLLTLSADE
jgi:hypothetical protein